MSIIHIEYLAVMSGYLMWIILMFYKIMRTVYNGFHKEAREYGLFIT